MIPRENVPMCSMAEKYPSKSRVVEVTSSRMNCTRPRKNRRVIAQKEMIAAIIWFRVRTDVGSGRMRGGLVCYPRENPKINQRRDPQDQVKDKGAEKF